MSAWWQVSKVEINCFSYLHLPTALALFISSEDFFVKAKKLRRARWFPDRRFQTLTQLPVVVNNRVMKNFMVIQETHDKEAALAYETYFNNFSPERMTHNEWASTTDGAFATAMQVWQGSSNFTVRGFKLTLRMTSLNSWTGGACESFSLQWSLRRIASPLLC